MKIRVAFKSGRAFEITDIDSGDRDRLVEDLKGTMVSGGCFVSRAKNSTIVAPSGAIEMVEFI